MQKHTKADSITKWRRRHVFINILTPPIIMDDYPTEKELKTIENWEIHTNADLFALVEYVQLLWHWGEDYCPLKEVKGEDYKFWRLVTGGWSGNEDLVCALRRNVKFWVFCWQASHRGGLHTFHIKNLR